MKLKRNQTPVEHTKHVFYLLVQDWEARGPAKFVKQNGIAFNFGNNQTYLVGIDNNLQQFLYDNATVLDFDFVDEPRKTSDIGNKYETFIFLG